MHSQRPKKQNPKVKKFNLSKFVNPSVAHFCPNLVFYEFEVAAKQLRTES